MKTPIAIFASGRGSNFDAIVDCVKRGKIAANIVAVVSDKKDALVLEKAEKLGLKTFCIPGPSKEAVLKDRHAARVGHEMEILTALSPLNPQFLVLAGYMRIMTPQFIETFRSGHGYSRIVNIHPSLLPSFPGVESYRQAFEYGVKFTGVTVHLVESQVDSGPICAQETFNISDCQSVEEVETRGLAIEHRLYPETLAWVLSEKFELVRNTTGRSSVRAN